jgi:hypothetical protein
MLKFFGQDVNFFSKNSFKSLMLPKYAYGSHQIFQCSRDILVDHAIGEGCDQTTGKYQIAVDVC